MIKRLIDKYVMFIKYLGVAGVSYIVDIVCFTIFSFVFRNVSIISYILLSTICARVISSILNFFLNKNKVFTQKNEEVNNHQGELILNYYLLVLVQMFVSAILVEILYKLTGGNLVVIKFVIDCLIFLENYFIQKKFIFNNKFLQFKKYFKQIVAFAKENKFICFILLVSIILHIAVLLKVGVYYGLQSDDASYIESGIYFKNNLTLIMHGEISAQIMPGMTYIIAIVSYVFGEGKIFMLALKILWMIMGVLSVLGIYKIVRLFGNKVISCLSAILLLAIDFIWMDNIILTETPFLFGFIYLIYATLMIAKTKEKKYFYQIVFFYMFCLLMKANIAPYPLFLVIYLLMKKYDVKLLFRQLLIAGGIMSIFFIPWIIRNYVVFDKFIPLTYGVGNPKLLGTYQGYNFPEDNEEEYVKYVNENASEEMKSYINGSATEKTYKRRYYFLEKDNLIAEYRMNKWWNDNRKDMLKSYLIYKPYVIAYNAFYWDTIWGISKTMLLKIRAIDIVLTIVCGLVTLLNRKHIKELIFLAGNYIFQVYVYSFTFAFDRYGQTIMFLRFIIIGIGLQILYDFIKSKINIFRRKKINEQN